MAAKPLACEIHPPAPLAPRLREQWMLDPSVDYLNHGCFGARPRAVFEAQGRYREAFEQRPIEALERQRDVRLNQAKSAVGGFVGMQPANFGFVTNVTEGLNALLRSLRLQPGDELVTTNHVYNAIRNCMSHLASRHEARYVEVEVPLPLQGPEQVIAAIEAALTSRTRLVVVDHVTSPTAVRFPVREILDVCASRSIDVAIDGAHAPGMIDLDVESLGAAYYGANLHKWVCAPVGAAFLWVRPDRQDGIHPTTISHFLGEGLAAEFAWQGTRDISPWLCVADAIAFLGELGWDHVRRHNHEMATWVQAMLCEQWKVEPCSPLDGSMLGSMVAVQLPGEASRLGTPETIQSKLNDAFRIEVPIFEWSGRPYIRPSCQVYNDAEQYLRLADAVRQLIQAES
ncbi:MAG: aminotransferase class V-fold PLP-dependent enzyme [Planctomycetota bacterium]|jgi:isopenicillin-N epimerase